MSPHWPSVRGRARADVGPLVLSALVVLLVSLLAGLTPGLIRRTADAAVRDAVRQAGDVADVTAQAGWEPDATAQGRRRMPYLAEDIALFRDRAADELSPGVRAVVRAPVASAISSSLKVTGGNAPRTLRLAYLDGGAGPRVEWVSGTAPGPSADGAVEVNYYAPPWPVRIGVSESAAALAGIRPGDRIQAVDHRGAPKDVEVSGIFRPMDRADPAWLLVPWLLDPAADADGPRTTRIGGLLSAESLPDARLALSPDELPRTVTFSPDPSRFTWDATNTIAASVTALKAASASSGTDDPSSAWNTQLDRVLREAAAQVEAARVQASVLLFAIVAAAALVLGLTAELLGRRRAAALALARQRGASLAGLGGELLLESALLTLTAAGLGCAGAYLITGSVSWLLVAPVVVTAGAAGPAYGLVAASAATRDRKVPANRVARRWRRHTRMLRRAAAEIGVLLAAIAAAVALRQRGVTGGLPVAAPALAAVGGALVLLRLLPVLTGLLLRQALRSRRPLAVFGTAQAASVAGRALPVLALVTPAALAVFAATLTAGLERGVVDSARETVGADARIDVAHDAAGTTAGLARRIAAEPGITSVRTAQVVDGARIVADGVSVPARLIIYSGGTADPAVPALVRSAAGSLRPGMRLELRRDGEPAIPMTATGVAPETAGADDIVVVDAAALAAAGMAAVPDTIWVNGPGTDRAVAGTGALLRSQVERERRAAPLLSGLLSLARVGAALLLLLGLLGLVLAAATGAGQRWEMLSRLRTLGLTPRDARRVAAGELLPVAALAVVGGPLLGVGLAAVMSGPLGLRLVTGQATEPGVAWPWAAPALLVVAFGTTVAAIVRAEAAMRRRRQLAEILRAGGS